MVKHLVVLPLNFKFKTQKSIKNVCWLVNFMLKICIFIPIFSVKKSKLEEREVLKYWIILSLEMCCSMWKGVLIVVLGIPWTQMYCCGGPDLGVVPLLTGSYGHRYLRTQMGQNRVSTRMKKGSKWNTGQSKRIHLTMYNWWIC